MSRSFSLQPQASGITILSLGWTAGFTVFSMRYFRMEALTSLEHAECISTVAFISLKHLTRKHQGPANGEPDRPGIDAGSGYREGCLAAFSGEVKGILVEGAVAVDLAEVDADGGLHAGRADLQHPGGWVQARLQRRHALDALRPRPLSACTDGPIAVSQPQQQPCN